MDHKTQNDNKQTVSEHATDSSYCPRCGEKLKYDWITFSHLGKWHCAQCKLKQTSEIYANSPLYPLAGSYNRYNIHAALSLIKLEHYDTQAIKTSLLAVTPAFGRQEQLIIKGKRVCIFLSKNPTGLNETLRTVKELGGEHILFVLNDRVADGKDVSWIWDTDLENILSGEETITASGDRVYDLALRIKYADKFKKLNSKLALFEDLTKAIQSALNNLSNDETLYIIPTYTAMLEIRKILTGKKIL